MARIPHRTGYSSPEIPLSSREVFVRILKSKPLCAVIVMFVLTAAAWPQQAPTLQSQTPSANIAIPVTAPPTPDTNPLSGAISQGLGTWGTKHSFYMPGFRVTEDIDSDPSLAGLDGTNPRGYANLAAGLQWVQYWGRDLELRYTGTVRYNSDAAPQVNQHFTDTQNASLVKQFIGSRHKVTLADQVDYTLYSNFAGAGMEGLGDISTQVSQLTGLQGIQLPAVSLQQQYVPVQNILTERTSRVSNVALGEVDYRISRRSTVTLTGAYALLQFPSATLINSKQSVASLGYNYQPTLRDTVAVEYDYQYFWYPGDVSIHDQFLQLKYSRRVTGRLSVGGGVGPQYIVDHVSGQDQTNVSWQGQANVQYRQGKLTASGSASRLVAGGGGVLQGTETQSGQGGLAYDFSKRLSSSFAFGVASSKDLGTGLTIPVEYVNVTLNRRVGRYANIFLSYYFSHQTTNEICSGVICGTTGTRQVGAIGLSWDYRPIPINF